MKPFRCNICDANFAQNYQLIVHNGSVHEEKKPSKWKIRDAKFAHNGQLKVRKDSVHEGKEPSNATFVMPILL